MNALISIVIFRVDGFMNIDLEFLEITEFLIPDLVTKLANTESNGTFQSNKTQKQKQTSNGSTAPL